jgi:phosphoribosylglycinamide formyltransferase-1
VKKINLAVLISGRGSNLQSLIDACARPDFPAQIAVVISNRPNVFGLQRAEKAGIPTVTIDHKDFVSREEFEAALDSALEDYPLDLVCLAGFMRILTGGFIRKWEGRMINIHPSLLPKYKGLDTHARALEAGDSEAGCSIHYVAEEVDGGEIIVQKSVPVLNGDTPETLAARVLEQEHIAYPEAVETLAKQMTRQ